MPSFQLELQPKITIIAGSRNITDYQLLCDVIDETQIKISEVVSGCCRGVDRLGERWAREHHYIPIKQFPAKWGDLTVENIFIKQGLHGPYNSLAGFNRNEEMACYAEQALLLWNGDSPGTEDMFNRCTAHGVPALMARIDFVPTDKGFIHKFVGLSTNFV